MNGTYLHLLTGAVVIGVVLLVCRAKRLPPRETLGLRWPPWGRFALLLAGFAALCAIEELIARGLGLGDVTIWAFAPVETVLRLLGVVVLAPVSEELVFRGLLYDRLSRGGAHVVRAVAVPALLFGLAHVAPGAAAAEVAVRVVQPTVDGLYFGFVRYRTRSTIATILLHALGNGFAAGQRMGWV